MLSPLKRSCPKNNILLVCIFITPPRQKPSYEYQEHFLPLLRKGGTQQLCWFWPIIFEYFFSTFITLKPSLLLRRFGTEQYVLQTILLILANNQLFPSFKFENTSLLVLSDQGPLGIRILEVFSLFSFSRFHIPEYYSITFNCFVLTPSPNSFMNIFKFKIQLWKRTKCYFKTEPGKLFTAEFGDLVVVRQNAQSGKS